MIDEGEPTSGSLDDQPELPVIMHEQDAFVIRVLLSFILLICVLLMPVVYALLIGGAVVLCFGDWSMVPHALAWLVLGLTLRVAIRQLNSFVLEARACLE